MATESFLVLLLCVLLGNASAAQQLNLTGVVKGDKIALSLDKRLPNWKEENSFFPQEASSLHPASAISMPFFQTKLANTSFDSLLAHSDSGSPNSDEYFSTLYTMTGTKTLHKWNIKGSLEGSPVVELKSSASLGSMSCLQTLVVPYPKNSSSTSEWVYCLQSKALVSLNSLPEGSHPIFFQSTYLNTGVEDLRLLPSFKTVLTLEGEFAAAYNLYSSGLTETSSPNTKVLFLTINQSTKELEETVVKISSDSFDDSKLASKYIQDLHIHNKPQLKAGFYLAHVVGRKDGSTGFDVFECMFKLKDLTIQNCSLVKTTDSLSKIQEITLRGSEAISDYSTEVVYELLVDGPVPQGIILNCTVTFVKNEKVATGCLEEYSQDYDLAISPNISPLKVNVFSNGVKMFYKSKEFTPESLLFSEVNLPDSDSPLIIYATNYTSFLPCNKGQITVGLSTQGLLSYFRKGSLKLLINTQKMNATSTDTSQFKVFYLNRDTMSFDHFWVYTIFDSNTFDIVQPTAFNVTVSTEKTLMRLSSHQIKGPSRYIFAEKDKGSVMHAPQVEVVFTVQHFVQSLKDRQKLERIKTNQATIGTMDFFIDLQFETVRNCRPFSQNYTSKTIGVLCGEQGVLSLKRLNQNPESISSFKLDMKRLVVVYPKKLSTKLDKVEICFAAVSLHTGWSTQSCLGYSDAEGKFSSKIVLTPQYAYVFASDGSNLMGRYLEWDDGTAKIIDLDEISPILTRDISAQHTKNQRGSDCELVFARAGLVYILTFKSGILMSDRHAFSTANTSPYETRVCKIENNLIVADSTNLYSLTADGESLPLARPADTADHKITSLECLDSGAVLVRRADIKSFSLIRDYQLIGNVSRKQTVFKVDDDKRFRADFDFFSEGHQYLFNAATSSVQVLSLSPFNIAIQSKTKSTGKVRVVLEDLFNNLHRTAFDGDYQAVVTNYDQDFSRDLHSVQAGEDSTVLNITYNPVESPAKGHFWKFESLPDKKRTILEITNRFKRLDIAPVQRNDSVCHLQDEGLEVYFVDERFVFYNEFSDKLVGEMAYDSHYLTTLLDLSRDKIDKTNYNLLAVETQGASRSLLNITFQKFNNNKFSFTSEKALGISLSPEDDTPKFAKTDAGWIIGYLLRSSNSKLVISNAQGSIFEKEQVYNFDIVQLAASEIDPSFIYLFYSTIDGQKLYQARLDIQTKEIKETVIDIGSDLKSFSNIKCQSSNRDNRLVVCVFAGISVAWVEIRLDKNARTFKTARRIEYEGYKNSEVKDIIIRTDPQGQRDYFILQIERINEDDNMTHDSSGLLYYAVGSDKPYRYAQGGLTNFDLLDICATQSFTATLTANETLLVPTCDGVKYFTITQPSLEGRNVSKSSLDQGLNVTAYGVNAQVLDFNKESIHQLMKFAKLITFMLCAILLSILAIIWVVTRKEKISLDSGANNRDDVYDKEEQSHADMISNVSKDREDELPT